GLANNSRSSFSFSTACCMAMAASMTFRAVAEFFSVIPPAAICITDGFYFFQPVFLNDAVKSTEIGINLFYQFLCRHFFCYIGKSFNVAEQYRYFIKRFC